MTEWTKESRDELRLRAQAEAELPEYQREEVSGPEEILSLLDEIERLQGELAEAIDARDFAEKKHAEACDNLENHCQTCPRIRQAVEQDGWMPIETAPKDGTPVLACIGVYATEAADIVLHPTTGPMTVYWGNYHPNSPGKGCWRDGNGHKRPYLTHWMPLPEPPEGRSQEGK